MRQRESTVRPAENTLGRIRRLALVWALLLAAFVVALSAVFALPQDPIRNNLRASLPQIEAEGIFPFPFIDNPVYQLDDYTDAQMLDIALARPQEDALHRAMGMRNGFMPPTAEDPIAALVESVNGSKSHAEPYAYYWHGYQLLLRPALLLLRYSDIRLMDLLLLGSLAMGLCLYMHDKAGSRVTVAYFLTLLLVGFYVVPASLQFSSVALIMLLATVAVLMAVDSGRLDRLDLEIFFIAGVFTTFMDLLTAPLLTLGMPLAVAIAVLGVRNRSRSLKEDLVLGARASLAWAVGYVLTWTSKALIATMVLKTDIIGRAMASLLLRSGVDERGSMIVLALRRNLLGLFPTLRVDPSSTGVARVAGTFPLLGVIVVVCALLIWVIMANRRPLSDIRRSAHVLLLAPFPYLWFVVMSNHSALHYWYSYRIQAMTVFGAVYVLIAAVDLDRLRGRLAALRGSADRRVMARRNAFPTPATIYDPPSSSAQE